MKMGQYQLSFLSGLLAAFGLGILCCAWLHIPFAEYLPYLITLLLLAAFASGILVLKQSERTWIAFVGLFFMLGIFRFAAVSELPAHTERYHCGAAAPPNRCGWNSAYTLYSFCSQNRTGS